RRQSRLLRSARSAAAAFPRREFPRPNATQPAPRHRPALQSPRRRLGANNPMKILVIDVGGTHIKAMATGHKNRLEIPSGPKMTARKMVAAVRKATAGWKYDTVSIGYPGPVIHGRPLREPHNLGPGWVGLDFRKA